MNIDNNLQLSEVERALVSDLADGLLRGAAFAGAMALLDHNSQARAYWHGLHAAGDVLRGDAAYTAADTAKDVAFLNRFRANLAKEPPLQVLSLTTDVRATEIDPHLDVAQASKVDKIANDGFFNWKWVGGLSAAAAIVAFSWNVVSNIATFPDGFPKGTGAQLAQATTQATPVVTQTAAGAMLRNPQLDALIAAHNQAGGSSALQMPSGFLRSATFTTDVSATGSGNP